MNDRKLKSFEEENDVLKERLIDKTIIVSGFFFIPAYISSLLRFIKLGWHPVYAFHTFIIVFLVFLIVRRNKLHHHLKTHIFCINLMLVSLGNIVFFQTAGDKILPIIYRTEAGKRINFQYPNLSMIALTMHQAKVYLNEIISAGYRRFVHKPDISKKIINALDNVLINKFSFTKDLIITNSGGAI